MHSPRLAPAAVAALTLALGTGAQEAAAEHAARQALAPESWLVPIHTRQLDHAGGEYGWWAAGPDFKVSFHDGFVFYPYLGPDYPENLPLRWRTTSVRAGGQELLLPGEAARQHQTEWRYDYRYAHVVEAYDVSSKGAEQTFTIRERPATPGPIVVRGAITTRLRAASVREHHGAVQFADADGKELVRYGAARAIDARGQETDVLTSFDGEHIELTLEARFVRAATFPVVIDPLTSAVRVSVWAGATWGLPVDTSIGRESESTTGNVMIAHARQLSATDYDLYVDLRTDSFGSVANVLRDLSATRSTRRPSVAAVGGADSWVVAYEVTAGSAAWIEVYVHTFANTVAGSGTTLGGAAATNAARYPRVGGQRSFTAGAMALLVFQFDVTNNLADTDTSEVYGRLIDAGNPRILPARKPAFVGPNVYLGGAPVTFQQDRERPCINQESAGGDASWIVGWQEHDRTGVPARGILRIARISPTELVPSRIIPQLRDRITDVRISGRDGRYLATYLESLDGRAPGYVLRTARFDWGDTAFAPAIHPSRVIETTPGAELFNGDLAHDPQSRSHWAVAWTRGTNINNSDVFVARVGFSGGIVEKQTVYDQPSTGGYAPSVTFDESARTFLIAHCAYDLGIPLPVYALKLTYPTNAASIPYGTACGGAISSTKPDAGGEFFTVSLAAGAANANQPAILLLGLAPTNASLASAGMPSCFLYADPFMTLNALTNASGSTSRTLALPDVPVVVGDVYFQWVFGSPSVPWPTRLAATGGLQSQIR